MPRLILFAFLSAGCAGKAPHDDGPKSGPDSPPAAAVSESTVGAVRVKLLSAEVTTTPAEDGKGAGGPMLLVRISVENTSTDRKVEHLSWSRPAGPPPKVTDDRGNVYRPDPRVRDVRGSVKYLTSIYPGKSVGDVLAFEPPVEAASWVTVELDAKVVGESGRFVLRFPAPRQ